MNQDDAIWVELTETGGFVGVPLRYGVRVGDLPERLRELVRRLESAPAPPAAPGLRSGNVPTTALYVRDGGGARRLDVSAITPEELEELAGELRGSPLPSKKAPADP